MAALSDGDRVLIIDRKLFKDDNTRFFVGVMEITTATSNRRVLVSRHVSGEPNGQDPPGAAPPSRRRHWRGRLQSSRR